MAGEIPEIREELNGLKEDKKKFAVKKVIGAPLCLPCIPLSYLFPILSLPEHAECSVGVNLPCHFCPALF